ncbi:MAG: hypothetical protein QUV05_22900 [Phycisphaerae bacterium]|nr:hypothetical protein [Phycisphaerae bacterium]
MVKSTVLPLLLLVPQSEVPLAALAVLLMPRSVCGVRLSVSVALSLVVFGSVTPVGAATVAVLLLSLIHI